MVYYIKSSKKSQVAILISIATTVTPPKTNLQLIWYQHKVAIQYWCNTHTDTIELEGEKVPNASLNPSQFMLTLKLNFNAESMLNRLEYVHHQAVNHLSIMS